MQTCSVGNLNMILAGVALVDVETVEVACQMIRRARVCVPLWVHGVDASLGVCRVGGMLAVLLGLVGVVEAVAAAECVVAILVTYLASWLRASAPAIATATALSAPSAVVLAAALSALSSLLLMLLLSAMVATATSTVIARHGVGGGVDLPGARR